jgi:hypothetical protein
MLIIEQEMLNSEQVQVAQNSEKEMLYSVQRAAKALQRGVRQHKEKKSLCSVHSTETDSEQVKLNNEQKRWTAIR